MNLIDLGEGLLVILVIIVIIFRFLILKITSETVTSLKTINPDSSGPRTIIIYSIGISDFHQKIVDAFASGLVASNWRVDMVTASSQTSTDLSGYSLLVIGGPIYGFQPSKTIRDYVDRLEDLKGLRVYTLLTGAGDSANAEEYISKWISEHGGVEVGKLTLFTQRPNTPVDGTSDAKQIATKAAQSLAK